MLLKNRGGEGRGWGSGKGPERRSLSPIAISTKKSNGNKIERWGTRSGRQRAVLESEKRNRGWMRLVTRWDKVRWKDAEETGFTNWKRWVGTDVQYKPSTVCASLKFGAISYQDLSGGKKRKSWRQKATRVTLISSARSAPEPRTQISVARRDRWSRKREASNLMIKSFILVYPFKNSSLFSRQVSAHTHTMKKLWSLVTE